MFMKQKKEIKWLGIIAKRGFPHSLIPVGDIKTLSSDSKPRVCVWGGGVDTRLGKCYFRMDAVTIFNEAF